MRIKGYSLSKRERLLIYLCLLLLVLTLFIRGIYLPLRRQQQEVQRELAFWESTLARRQQPHRDVQAQQAKAQAVYAELIRLTSNFYYGLDPEEAGLLLLAEATQAATAAGLELTSRSLSTPQALKGATRLEAELVFKAEPNAVMAFLRGLAQCTPTLTPRFLSLVAQAEGLLEGKVKIQAVLVTNQPKGSMDALADALVRSGVQLEPVKLQPLALPAFADLGRLFFPPSPPEVVPQPSSEVAPPVETGPAESQFILKGIVYQQGRAHAVLGERETGQTHLVGVGDVIAGETVVAITGDSVTLRYGKKEWSLKMPQ